MQVMFGWRKATEEMTKRLDPNLLFYYHTSTHKRFSEGQLLNFSDAPKKPRQQYASRRELLTHNIGGRVTLVQRGATSIRTQYHNVPVELPPPPGASLQRHITEHSYSTH